MHIARSFPAGSAALSHAAEERLCPDEWHSRLRRLYAYWQSICPADGLPGRQHFDPTAVTGVLPHVWLLDVQAEPFRLCYRLVGTAVSEAHRRELKGLWFDEAHPDLAKEPEFLARYRRVVETRRPSWRKGSPYMSLHHRMVENLVLPMARNGRDVDMLLCITQLHEPIGA